LRLNFVKNAIFGRVVEGAIRTMSRGVLLYYIPGEGRSPLILGKATDCQIFAGAAEAAIREAESQASTESDPTLAAAQLEEVSRLRKLLALLTPVIPASAVVM
jgi:hypothetical protein